MTPWAQVRHRLDGEVPIVAVDGEIDIANVADVEDKIVQCVPNSAIGAVLDLSAATYLDSQGLRMLLTLAERLRNRRQRFAIVAPAPSFVRRIIELSQLHTVIPVEVEVAPALAQVRGNS